MKMQLSRTCLLNSSMLVNTCKECLILESSVYSEDFSLSSAVCFFLISLNVALYHRVMRRDAKCYWVFIKRKLVLNNSFQFQCEEKVSSIGDFRLSVKSIWDKHILMQIQFLQCLFIQQLIYQWFTFVNSAIMAP